MTACVLCVGRNSGLYIKSSQNTVYNGDVLELDCIWNNGVQDSENAYDEISWAKVNDMVEGNVEFLGPKLRYLLRMTLCQYLSPGSYAVSCIYGEPCIVRRE